MFYLIIIINMYFIMQYHFFCCLHNFNFFNQQILRKMEKMSGVFNSATRWRQTRTTDKESNNLWANFAKFE